MLLSKKTRLKPIFKQFLKLRENVQNQKKLLGFQNKKWEHFINSYKRKMRRYKKYVAIDQIKYSVTKFPSKGTSYKKRYRDSLHTTKKLALLYGGITSRQLKKYLNLMKKKNGRKNNEKKETFNLLPLKKFESRLDIVLHRAKFVFSIKAARQLIVHGNVYVNQVKIKSKSHILRPGDSIEMNSSYSQRINESSFQTLKSKPFWPLPPNHLHINYRTMQIIFGTIDLSGFSTAFTFHLQLKNVVLNSRYQ
jgi:ribosomal protein S4|uniref:Ribosomal protein S4 n=1 Tax=Phaeodactylum tricornutum TaxID=2850 RepID=A0A6G7IVU0_PHATR|nr:ribosomal protein S4 [Phaeodactylum tricornutum]